MTVLIISGPFVGMAPRPLCICYFLYCCWLFVTMIKVVMMTMLMVISVIVFVVIFLSYLELYIFSYKNVDRIYEQVCNYSWDPL